MGGLERRVWITDETKERDGITDGRMQGDVTTAIKERMLGRLHGESLRVTKKKKLGWKVKQRTEQLWRNKANL